MGQENLSFPEHRHFNSHFNLPIKMAPSENFYVPRSIIAPSNHLKVVDKALSLPLVSSACSEVSRATSPYMESTLSKVSPVMENTMGMVDIVKSRVEEQVLPHIPTKLSETVQSVQETVVDQVMAAVEKADTLACGGIDQLTEKLSQLKDATPKLINETKTSVTSFVISWSEYFASFPVAMVALTVVDITLGRVEEALRNMEPNARTMTSLVQMVHSAANTLRLRASRDVTDASDDDESSDPDTPSPPAHHVTSGEPTNLTWEEVIEEKTSTKPSEVLQKFTAVEDVSANEVAKKEEASRVDPPTSTTPKTPTTIYSLLSQVRSEEVNKPTVTEDIKKVAAVKEVFATEVVQHEEESKVDKQTTPKTPTTNSLTKWFSPKRVRFGSEESNQSTVEEIIEASATDGTKEVDRSGEVSGIVENAIDVATEAAQLEDTTKVETPTTPKTTATDFLINLFSPKSRNQRVV